MIKEETYSVSGMTCQGCASKVEKTLQHMNGVRSADVVLGRSEVSLRLDDTIQLDQLQSALSVVGGYNINVSMEEAEKSKEELADISFATYWPLVLIVMMLIGVASLVQYPWHSFSIDLWMRHFMAGFFLVFAFFKLLNISGFANSYAMYDVVASKWKTWGYIYPFVELGLGIAYLIDFNPWLTNITTVVVLGVSSIGVILSNINGQKIKCACLGDVFNLPMSTVTIVEDVTMVLMAIYMLM